MFLHCFPDASFPKYFSKYFLLVFLLLSYTRSHEILTVHILSLMHVFQLQQTPFLSLTESLLADVESNKTEVASESFLTRTGFH